MLYALLRPHISTGKSTACSAAISSDGLKDFKGAVSDFADGSLWSTSDPDSGFFSELSSSTAVWVLPSAIVFLFSASISGFNLASAEGNIFGSAVLSTGNIECTPNVMVAIRISIDAVSVDMRLSGVFFIFPLILTALFGQKHNKWVKFL
jgi:hypothetical protein